MNIYRHELRMNLKNTVLWTIILSVVGGTVELFYVIIEKDIRAFSDMMNNFPDSLKSVMGLITENFSTPLGFYGFVLTFSLLFASIQAMNIGVAIVSKETRDKTADFLLTKPVSRFQIISEKILAAVTLLGASWLVYSGTLYFVIWSLAKGDFAVEKYLLLCAGYFLLQLIFFSVGLLVSVLAKKIKAVLPVSMGIVFFAYAVSAFAVTSESDALRFLTPFQYFKTEYILKNGSFELPYLITGLAVILVAILCGYVRFIKKDIHAV